MSLTIASIEPKKRRPQVYVIAFEDGETLELPAEVVLRRGLGRGSVIGEEEMEVILREGEEHRCREAAWRLLSVRPRTRKELKQALRQRRFLSSTAERITEDLAAKGYIDDDAFARQFVEERTRRRHGPRLIEQELLSRGLTREQAHKAMAGTGDRQQQEEAVRALLERWNRRSTPAEPRKRRLAAAQFLLRRGYDAELAWEAVRAMLGGEEE